MAVQCRHAVAVLLAHSLHTACVGSPQDWPVLAEMQRPSCQPPVQQFLPKSDAPKLTAVQCRHAVAVMLAHSLHCVCGPQDWKPMAEMQQQALKQAFRLDRRSCQYSGQWKHPS